MKTRFYVLMITSLYINFTSQRKCWGLNVGKNKQGHEVINDGILSPEFSLSNPYFNH